MSRIDDVRADQRAEEARRADIRAKELQEKKRVEEVSAFDRALAEKTVESNTKSATDRSRQLERQSQQTREAESRRGETKATQTKDAEEGKGTANAAQRGLAQLTRDRRLAIVLGGQQQSSRASDSKATSAKDQKNSAASKEESKGSDEAKAKAAQAGGKRLAPVSAREDEGGSGGKNQGNKDQQPSAFRLPPPALMAPPPVAVPKESGDPRLRAFMKEMVDKIVSRVMVGHNEKGLPEFRIELKSSVLKGLSIKVSGGRGGKIRAVFSGSDREVLEALKRSSGGLVSALRERGLTLEELVVEDSGAR